MGLHGFYPMTSFDPILEFKLKSYSPLTNRNEWENVKNWFWLFNKSFDKSKIGQLKRIISET